MVINLKLSDELFEHYVKKYGLPKAYQMMKKAVEQMKDVDENDRYLLIAGDIRRDIEKTFQTTLDSGEKLAKLCHNLSVVSIGGIEHQFTPDELARLDMQATFHGRTREVFIKEMIDEIAARMLEQV